jgi:hypothetical protein
MNPATFLHNTQRIITGKGFKKVIEVINHLSLRNATDGIVLTASTEPALEAEETNFIIVESNTSQTSLGRLTFQVPRDYDQSLDHMAVRFLCNSSGTTDAPTIDATLYQKVPATALSSDLNPTISAAISKTSATTGTGWVEVVASGLGLKPGAMVTWVFTVSAHTSDEVNVYGLEVVYNSDLVYYDPTDR